MYAAGTYLGGMEAFGGTGYAGGAPWTKFSKQLLNPLSGEGIGNIFNPTGGLGKGQGWGMFQGAPAATSSPYLASGAAGGARLPGAANILPKASLWDKGVAALKNPWVTIPAASVAAGLYTAKMPLDDLDDSTDEWDKEKAEWDARYAGMEGAFRLPEDLRAAQGGRIGRQKEDSWTSVVWKKIIETTEALCLWVEKKKRTMFPQD